MRNILAVPIALCLVLSGLTSTCLAQGKWKHSYANRSNVAYWSGAAESFFGVYTLESGEIWLAFNLPSDSQPIDTGKPFTVRVDNGKEFSPHDPILQPLATSICWQLAGQDEKVKSGSLLSALMKGRFVSVSGTMIDGQKFTTKIPLKGSGKAIKKLLANRR